MTISDVRKINGLIVRLMYLKHYASHKYEEMMQIYNELKEFGIEDVEEPIKTVGEIDKRV